MIQNCKAKIYVKICEWAAWHRDPICPLPGHGQPLMTPTPQRPHIRHSPGHCALVTAPGQLVTTLQPQKGTLLGVKLTFFCHTTIFSGEQCQLWSNSVNVSHTEFYQMRWELQGSSMCRSQCLSNPCESAEMGLGNSLKCAPKREQVLTSPVPA